MMGVEDQTITCTGREQGHGSHPAMVCCFDHLMERRCLFAPCHDEK